MSYYDDPVLSVTLSKLELTPKKNCTNYIDPEDIRTKLSKHDSDFEDGLGNSEELHLASKPSAASIMLESRCFIVEV